jgi:hypothetical protein
MMPGVELSERQRVKGRSRESRYAQTLEAQTLEPVSISQGVMRRAMSDGDSLQSSELLNLQRSIGNRAVANLLGRGTAQQTNSPQVGSGTIQRTPDAQGAVQRISQVGNGSPTVQRDHLDTGLGKQKSVERYTGKVKARFSGEKNPMGSKKEWSTLNDTARQDKLLKYVNKELKTSNVPILKGMVQDPTAAQPSFDFRTWTIKVVGQFDRTDAPYLRWLAYTVYHEARHAEQHFRIARKLAGEGEDATQIAASTYIPLDIAQAAVKRPLKEQSKTSKFFHSKKYNERQSKKLGDANAWHRSIYGADSGARTAILTSPNMTPGTDVYNQYLNLPEEVDAYSTQNKVEQEYDA